MKETTSVAMPSCFHRWCDRFKDVLKTKAQKTGVIHYIGGLAKNRKVIIKNPGLTQNRYI